MKTMMDIAKAAPSEGGERSSAAKSAGEALLAAIKSGDGSKVARAMRSAMAVCDYDDDDDAPPARKAPSLAVIIGAKKGK